MTTLLRYACMGAGWRAPAHFSSVGREGGDEGEARRGEVDAGGGLVLVAFFSSFVLFVFYDCFFSSLTISIFLFLSPPPLLSLFLRSRRVWVWFRV